MPVNPAANLIFRILQLKCPKPLEPEQYTSQAEALTILRQVSGLKREEMAFRLGTSISMLDKAEGGTAGGRFQIEQLEKAQHMAIICNLPVMAQFFHILHIHTRKHAKRGPKRDSAQWWKDEESKEDQ